MSSNKIIMPMITKINKIKKDNKTYISDNMLIKNAIAIMALTQELSPSKDDFIKVIVLVKRAKVIELTKKGNIMLLVAFPNINIVFEEK